MDYVWSRVAEMVMSAQMERGTIGWEAYHLTSYGWELEGQKALRLMSDSFNLWLFVFLAWGSCSWWMSCNRSSVWIQELRMCRKQWYELFIYLKYFSDRSLAWIQGCKAPFIHWSFLTCEYIGKIMIYIERTNSVKSGKHMFFHSPCFSAT